VGNLNVNRRSFLTYGLAAGAFVIAAPVSALARSMDDHDAEADDRISPLIQINPDNSMVFFSPSPDMGQGTDTSLAMLFAEELGADFDHVFSKPLPLMLRRNEDGGLAWAVAPQGAGGSTSISDNWTLLRNAGATVRQLLLQAAAKHFGTDVGTLRAENSFVISPSGGRVSFGALAKAAAAETLPEDYAPNLKARDEWNVIGTSEKNKVAREIVTGKPLYGMDMDYPGAKAAMIERSPYLDGYVENVDDTAARALPGVLDVIVMDRPDPSGNYTYLAAGVAIVAEDVWTAKKARGLLKITWNKGPHTAESSQTLNDQCEELLKGEGQIVRSDGDFAAAVAAADKVITRTYKLPLVSHAQLEPQNCIAHVREDSATVIGPFQSPSGASRFASAITGIDRLSIEVRYTRLGGGFGRRLTSDHAAEAVTIAKQSGYPIRLVWTREDDLQHDFYRPMGHHEMTAAVDGDGNVTAWAQRLAGTPKHYRRGRPADQLFGADLYVDDFPAGVVDNLKLEYFVAKSGAPQGSWRAPAHTANAFVIQSFMDEIAQELGEDPLAFRLRMLGAPQEFPYGQHGSDVYDTGRLRGVLELAAEKANWGKRMPEGHAQGIAGHFTFGGYCAHVVEVELLEEGKFKVHKVTGAIDVGTVVNRAGVIAQMEGGINDGLSACMGQQVRIEGGRMVNDNFDSYHMMRIADAPPVVDTHIVDSTKDPVGMGEMSLPPMAPAVMNAVVRAGGARKRAQPFFNGGT